VIRDHQGANMPTQAYLRTLPAITLQTANNQQKPLLEQALK